MDHKAVYAAVLSDIFVLHLDRGECCLRPLAYFPKDSGEQLCIPEVVCYHSDRSVPREDAMYVAKEVNGEEVLPL